ncbi:hypothetical protein RIF29_24008 [Crotalaria pallida]|uniref:Uncharacterized protein n=1 Tax=Crotalaria pallida TaxID=3830 RepID=A0AAN9I2U4_CROPI
MLIFPVPIYTKEKHGRTHFHVGLLLAALSLTLLVARSGLAKSIQGMTPQSVRALFKDPCKRLAAEVSKVLIELSNSTRKRHHCSPEILSDHLHEALKDLNTAIKSQPRLFVGPKHRHNRTANAQVGQERHGKASGFSISTVKTDSSALLDWKTKHSKENERKSLRPQLSKIAITSLEFSEALPFAAFASLLVERVAKLDLVIEEIEELGRLACFKVFRPVDEVVVTCEEPRVDVLQNHLPSHGHGVD